MARPIYTPEEEEAIRRLFPTASKAEIVAAIPTHTWHEIQMAASRRGIARPRRQHNSRWEGAAATAILTRYAQEGAQKIAAEFGFQPHAVSSKARVMGVRYQPVKKPHKRELERLAHREAKRAARWEASQKGRQAKEVKAAQPIKRKPVTPKKLKSIAPKPQVPAVVEQPVKRSPTTPILNARVEARRRADKQQVEKPKPYVTADQVRKLPASHPARLAYTRAAYHGPAAATEAFHAAMKQAA